MPVNSAILIAGPTASGKSALALRLSQEVGGVIVNADSMQVYRDLRILTARPSAAEEAEAPHRLYGHVDGTVAFSAAAWAAELDNLLVELGKAGQVPIIVGGTGLYFRTALEGLAPVPDISPEVREAVRKRVMDEGPEALHRDLQQRDPEMAAKLNPGDTQRVCRALEVILSTGHSLAAWQREQPETPLGILDKQGRVFKCVLTWPRIELLERCDSRLEEMAETGALEEVKALLDRGLDPDLPVMKALGVSAFAGHLEGEYDLSTAIGIAQMQTHQYVKRQSTWFRNQFRWWQSVDAQDSERMRSTYFPKIRDFVLTRR